MRWDAISKIKDEGQKKAVAHVFGATSNGLGECLLGRLKQPLSGACHGSQVGLRLKGMQIVSVA
jgi:hypothetical protein